MTKQDMLEIIMNEVMVFHNNVDYNQRKVIAEQVLGKIMQYGGKI